MMLPWVLFKSNPVSPVFLLNGASICFWIDPQALKNQSKIAHTKHSIVCMPICLTKTWFLVKISLNTIKCTESYCNSTGSITDDPPFILTNPWVATRCHDDPNVSGSDDPKIGMESASITTRFRSVSEGEEADWYPLVI